MRPLVILFAVALAASGLAQGDVKSRLQTTYNALAAAFGKGDISLYDQTLAPEYELHVGPRTQKKDAILRDFKRQMANMKNSRWTRLVTKTTTKGDKVQVTVKSTFNGDVSMKGKTTHFYNEATSLDTWTMRGGKWLLIESNLMSLDAKLDGKPAGHFPEKG
jgi:predicted SnoaL-like aldol condensation-catalyzing enzyme